jgi:hypothetical protein
MTEVAPVTPNPFSPYATADPNTRHLLPGFTFASPQLGHLAPTGCNRLAVVPTSPLRTASEDNTFPPGICETCIAAWYAAQRGEELRDDRPLVDCRDCGSLTRHDGLCAMCRQDEHEAWWAREHATTGLKP